MYTVLLLSVPRCKLLPPVRHKKTDPFCILEPCNTIGRKELKGAVLLPVCKKVCSWTVVLSLPLRLSLILRQSQSFSSVVGRVGVPPHLVTLPSSSKQCELRQHGSVQRGLGTSTVGSDVYKTLWDSWKA